MKLLDELFRKSANIAQIKEARPKLEYHKLKGDVVLDHHSEDGKPRIELTTGFLKVIQLEMDEADKLRQWLNMIFEADE